MKVFFEITPKLWKTREASDKTYCFRDQSINKDGEVSSDLVYNFILIYPFSVFALKALTLVGT